MPRRLAEGLFVFVWRLRQGSKNVLLLRAETTARVYMPLADAVCFSSASGGLLSAPSAGICVPAAAGRLRLSASTSDVPVPTPWSSVLLPATDGQGSVAEPYPYLPTAFTKARTFSQLR